MLFAFLTVLTFELIMQRKMGKTVGNLAGVRLWYPIVVVVTASLPAMNLPHFKNANIK